jgi:uncharacterized protein (TIGR00251 family)
MTIRVKTRARQEGLVCGGGAGYKVSVKAAPEKGQANKRVCQIVAAFFGVPASRVEIVRGHTARDKQLRIIGLALGTAQARLASLDEPS